MSEEKAPTTERPLESRLLRMLLPVGLDMGMAAGGAPPLARYVAMPALNAAFIAYDAPPGEKLLRAILEGGGRFTGGLAGRALHPVITAPLEDAAIDEINRPPSRSTLGGRLALLGVSPVGRGITGIVGSNLGQRAGRRLADELAPKAKEMGLP